MSSRWSTALYAAAAAVMIALLVLVWTHPAIASAASPRPHPAATSTTGADQGSDPCSAVIGPAHAVCNGSASAPALPRLGSLDLRHGAVLLPATLAVAAAIGLALLAERRAK
ncbi:hypothetical protein ACWGCW_25930 [Streptomyces sp. NPDC054933]